MVHLRRMEPSPDHLSREPYLDAICKLTPPVDFVSVLVLNVTDDVALFLRYLEDCSNPVVLGPLLGISWRTPRPFPEFLDIGAVGCVEATAIEPVEVETNGVRNRDEHFLMGEIVDLDSDLYLTRALDPAALRSEANMRENAHVWIRVPGGTPEPTAENKAVGFSDWFAIGVHAEDSGLPSEVELGPKRIVAVPQVHDGAWGCVVPFVVPIVRPIRREQVFFLDIKAGVMFLVQFEDSIRLHLRQPVPVLDGEFTN